VTCKRFKSLQFSPKFRLPKHWQALQTPGLTANPGGRLKLTGIANAVYTTTVTTFSVGGKAKASLSWGPRGDTTLNKYNIIAFLNISRYEEQHTHTYTLCIMYNFPIILLRCFANNAVSSS
jgi:hypothetical protein